jgi:hypothetical protein
MRPGDVFTNGQWSLTESTLRCNEYEYEFELSRLLETRGSGDDLEYDWPLHMAEKEWVDINAFNLAWLLGACVMDDFDEEMAMRSCAQAWYVSERAKK